MRHLFHAGDVLVIEDVVRTLLSLTAVLLVPTDASASDPDGALSVQRMCHWLVEHGAEDILLACRPLDFFFLAITDAAGASHALALSAKLCVAGRTRTCVT